MENHQILYIDAEKAAKYEALMSGPVDYKANGIHSNTVIETWTASFGSDKEMRVELHSGDAAKNEPLWAEAAMVLYGKRYKTRKRFERLIGDYECWDTLSNPYYLSLMPSGLLSILNPDVIEIQLEKCNEVEIMADDCSAVKPEFENYVEYYIPVCFDPDTAFSTNFHVESPENDAWLNIYVRYYPDNNDVGMLVVYDSGICMDSFWVELSEAEKARLRDVLFAKAKDVYGLTPTEEWVEFVGATDKGETCWVLTSSVDPGETKAVVFRDVSRAKAAMKAEVNAMLEKMSDEETIPLKKEKNSVTLISKDDGIGYDAVCKWTLVKAEMDKED